MARSDLVEERLEEVEVAPVDHRQLDLLVSRQLTRRIKPAESGTDDDHVVRQNGRPHSADSMPVSMRSCAGP